MLANCDDDTDDTDCGFACGLLCQVGIALETLDSQLNKLWLYPATPSLTQQWYSTLKRLLPAKTATLTLT